MLDPPGPLSLYWVSYTNQDSAFALKATLQRIRSYLGISLISLLLPAGDLMGRAMKNLDRLLAMPYGCGEQNMVLFAPNIFILNYLKSTGQLTTEILDKARRFLESGKSLCVPVPLRMVKYASQYKKLSKDESRG